MMLFVFFQGRLWASQFHGLGTAREPRLHVDSVRTMNLFHKIREVMAALEVLFFLFICYFGSFVFMLRLVVKTVMREEYKLC